MKYLFISLILVAHSTQAFALQKQQAYTLSSKTMALPLAPYEVTLKSSLIKMRLYDPAKFLELKKSEESNAEVYQSYINEVYDLFGTSLITKHNPKLSFYDQFMKNSKIDLAKKVAKYEMYKNIEKNWPVLKTTIFNEEGVESWKEARRFTLRKLNDFLIYSPQHQYSKTHFLFLFGQNFIRLDKATLKKVHIGLDINSRLDANTLPPEAANIKLSEEDEQTRPSSRTTYPQADESSKKHPPKSIYDENPSLPEVDPLEIF
ncbi:MAG: hypothetical protein IPM57_00830 [Oligoflexia bacterium]|nr:hypothetical protein [Oligoflexia bacterium]